MAYEKPDAPVNYKMIQNILSAILVAEISPYPTVVIVVVQK
jgi:hypothetical protein